MAVWPATYTAVSDTQQNHYIHIFFREQAVSRAKFSDESDYEDKKRSMEQWGAPKMEDMNFFEVAEFCGCGKHIWGCLSPQGVSGGPPETAYLG